MSKVILRAIEKAFPPMSLEERRQHEAKRSSGYWLPPRRWKTRLYNLFGKTAPDRWISTR